LEGERAEAERTEAQQRADRESAQAMAALARHYHDPANPSAARQVPGGPGGAPQGGGHDRLARSIGERFVESDQFRNYRDHVIGSGARSVPLNVGSLYERHADEVERRFGGGPEGQRALVTSTTLAPVIQPQRLPGIVIPELRELRVRDILANGRTDTNVIEWVKEVSRTNGAAEVAEATSLTTGLKPESGFALGEDSTTVRTVATLIYINRNTLADAAQMRTYIDQLLTRFVEEREDRQLLLGDGVSPNLRGLLATPGRLVLNGAYFLDAMPNKLDRLYRAKTRVRIAGRGRVSAYVLNPENVEEFALMKTNATAGNNEYVSFKGTPFNLEARTVWGTPFVENEDIAVNRAAAVDGRWQIVFDRMETTIYVTDSNRDLFERNIITLLCESRLALASIRPETIADVDLVATA
jgi:HK97 family phage major capsid protein